MPYIFKDLVERADIVSRVKAVEQYNKRNKWRKRGIAFIEEPAERMRRNCAEYQLRILTKTCSLD